MKPLVLQKQRALEMRRKGASYREILNEVSVAKSTLSAWLQEMPLTDSEKNLLKRRLNSNISQGRIRAAASLREIRLKRDQELFVEAKREFEAYKTEPLFQLGIGFYWAEGSKRNATFAFMNSDPEMVVVMLAWIEKYLRVEKGKVGLRLFTHKPFATENLEGQWAQLLQVPISTFKKTIYKPTGLLVRKRPGYMGCLRLEIGKVACLRKMLFWKQMLIEYYKKER